MQLINPQSNRLPPGMSEDLLDDAISRSGYPLQQIVAHKFELHKFLIRHEWAFQDPILSKIRTTDLLAEKPLYKFGKDLRVRPAISILVECKRSLEPYVFFLSDTDLDIDSTLSPLVSGLRSHYVSVYIEGLNGSVQTKLSDALNFRSHKFIAKVPYKSLNFTKAHWQTKKVSLSGDDPYNSLVLPLVSAMREFAKIKHPASTIRYFDAHLTIGLAVVDAPMQGVRVTKDGHKSESIPWVRVFRHEPDEKMHKFERDDALYAIDVVHIDYLDSYIKDHLMPFSSVFTKNVLERAEVLASGRGLLDDVDSLKANKIKSIHPLKSLVTRANRFKTKRIS